MVRLSCHDEVAVCFHCLDWLKRRRSAKRRELFRAGLPGWSSTSLAAGGGRGRDPTPAAGRRRRRRGRVPVVQEVLGLTSSHGGSEDGSDLIVQLHR